MQDLYDLIIIGGGPAGLSAAIYAGRSMLKVLVLDTNNAGGQISITADVVNYPGVAKTSGAELTKVMRSQAQNFGAQLKQSEVVSVDFSGDIKTVDTKNGDKYSALSVLIATGAHPRKLGFPGEEEFGGRGIGYCATCDGEFFTGLDVFVVGGGFAASEEAIYLTRFAKKVYMIVRGDKLDCASSIIKKVESNPKIEIYYNSEVVKAEGDDLLRSLVIKDNATGSQWTYYPENKDQSFGIFVFIGYIPISQLFEGHVNLDSDGYIPTDEDLCTNVTGVYAAGDIRPKKLRQLVTSVADGAVAATSIEKFVDKQKEKLNITIDTDEQDTHEASQTNHLIDSDILNSLKPILERFETTITLRLSTPNLADDTAKELDQFIADVASITDKIKIERVTTSLPDGLYPELSIIDSDGKDSGIYFHGVPSGHEFNSFVLAIYNVAGPGQQIDSNTIERIKSLPPKDIKVAATLSCTMCPDVVQSTQLIARYNPNITAHMIDVSKFPQFKATYKIMSVPAIILDNDKTVFGKKSLDEIIELLK